MKKTVLFLLLTTMLLAQGYSADWYISVDASCPLVTEKLNNTTSVAGGFQSRCMFNGFIGIYTSADFIVPLNMTSTTLTDYEWIYGFDAMVGLTFQLVNSTYFRLVVIPGGNVYSTIAEKTLENDADFYLGPSLNLGTEFTFGGNFYITASLTSFINIYKINLHSDYVADTKEAKQVNTFLFGLQPRLGFGYKF